MANLNAVLAVQVIAAFLTGLTVIFTVLAWKSRYWTVPHLLCDTIIAVSLTAMLWGVNSGTSGSSVWGETRGIVPAFVFPGLHFLPWDARLTQNLYSQGSP